MDPVLGPRRSGFHGDCDVRWSSAGSLEETGRLRQGYAGYGGDEVDQHLAETDYEAFLDAVGSHWKRKSREEGVEEEAATWQNRFFPVSGSPVRHENRKSVFSLKNGVC